MEKEKVIHIINDTGMGWYKWLTIGFVVISSVIGIIVFITRSIKNWDVFWKNYNFRKYIWHKNKEIKSCTLKKINKNKKKFRNYNYKYEKRIRNIINDKVIQEKIESSYLFGEITRQQLFEKWKNNQKINVSLVNKWPKNLSSIDWTGFVGLEQSTPFKGDVSSFNIKDCILNGVDVSRVTKWPKNLNRIDWKGVLGLEQSTPFKGDISEFDIRGCILNGVDVSKVTKWPQQWDCTSNLKLNNVICTLKEKPEEWEDYIWDYIQKYKQK